MFGTSKINVAVIGANFGARVHIPAFQLVEDANVAALCSKNISNAITMGSQYNIPVITDNLSDIMNNKDIHAVSVAVPPSQSYEILKSAIRHGKHLFCEKPLTANLSDAIKIKNLLTDKIIHAIDFEICECAAVKSLKEKISAKYLGDIRYFQFNWKLITNSFDSTWKLDANNGGGALHNFGSHTLHLLEWVFSDRIQTISGKLLPSLSFNTFVDAIIEFSSFGGSVCIDANTKTPSDFFLRIVCEDGSFVLQNDTGILKNFSLLINKNDKTSPIIDCKNDDLSERDGRIDLVSSLARRFIEGIKNNTQIIPNIEDGLRVQFLTNILLREARQ